MRSRGFRRGLGAEDASADGSDASPSAPLTHHATISLPSSDHVPYHAFPTVFISSSVSPLSPRSTIHPPCPVTESRVFFLSISALLTVFLLCCYCLNSDTPRPLIPSQPPKPPMWCLLPKESPFRSFPVCSTDLSRIQTYACHSPAGKCFSCSRRFKKKTKTQSIKLLSFAHGTWNLPLPPLQFTPFHPNPAAEKHSEPQTHQACLPAQSLPG